MVAVLAAAVVAVLAAAVVALLAAAVVAVVDFLLLPHAASVTAMSRTLRPRKACR